MIIMQFKVPQDVQRADRIVGPLTLRQLIICGIGFTISYGIYTVLGRDYELITAIIPVAMENRADLIALSAFGTEKLWWLICSANGIIDPTTELVAGKQIKIPIIR